MPRTKKVREAIEDCCAKNLSNPILVNGYVSTYRVVSRSKNETLLG